MARKSDLIEVGINRNKNVVTITTTRDGVAISSSIFTPEEAAQHAKQVQTGVDMLLGRNTNGLILPEKMN